MTLHSRFDLRPLGRGRQSRLHDPVDEQSEPALGWYPAGRRVRMGQQPALLQFLHHPADRGRRQADIARQHLRPDRNPALDIGIDDQPEDLAHAVGEFGKRGGHGAIHLGLRCRPV